MPSFRVIVGPDQGQVFRFSDRLCFGRSKSSRADNTACVCLTDPRISREHLLVYEENSDYFAVDKYSSNGSYIEGQRLKSNQATPLPDQAQVRLGDTILIFSSRKEELAESAQELQSPPVAEKSSGGIVNPSMVINAQEWLDKLRERGPSADARNLSRQIKAITNVSLALGGTTDISQLSEQIVQSLFAVFQNAENIFLFAYHADTDQLIPITNQAGDEQVSKKVSRTITQQVIRDRNAILIYDAMSDKSYQDQESIHALGLRSVICVPLLFKNQLLGLVQIDSRSDANRFTNEDLEILTGISAQIAVALKNTELFRDIENLLEGFVSASVQVIESRDPVTAGHSFRVAYYTEALAVAADRHDTGPLKTLRFNETQVRELRYAALLHDFGKIGVKEEILTKENKLFDHQIDNIRLRFDYAKACMERHVYYQILKNHETQNLTRQELQERLNELQSEFARKHAHLDAYLEKILQHNKPNLTHSDMSELLSDIYQETFEDLEAAERPLLTGFEFSALQIPKGSLTAEERHEIEMHVTHTYNFLNLIPWTEDLCGIPAIAHAHHEKLDGSGYPNSLKGAEIPIQSRIMAIADIYDALTASDRPYKTSVTSEVALEMLEREAKAGKLDSELIDIFILSRAYLS